MYTMIVKFGEVNLGSVKLEYTRVWEVTFPECDGFGHAERLATAYLDEADVEDLPVIDVESVDILSITRKDV